MFDEILSSKKSKRKLHILVAQDKRGNHASVSEMLERMGHSTTVVESGTEALKAFEREKFSLVLMDVQMPEMDGFDAVKKARQFEKISGEHVPVIAMTACAQNSHKEQWLEAGMDGCLPVPLTAQDLYETIENVSCAFERTDEQTVVCTHSDHVLDVADLLERVDGDRELLGELVSMFLEDYRSLLSKIHEAVKYGDATSLTKAAHTLKGAVGNFSAERASQAARKLECMGRSGDMVHAHDALAHLEDEMSQLVTELTALRKEIRT